MSKFQTLIDFGSKNLRLSVFDNYSKCIYFSKVDITKDQENINSEKLLNELVRNAEKYLSIHLEDVNILYDTSKFKFIDISIKKSFDYPTLIKKNYEKLIEETNHIISENNFKDQIIHIVVNNVKVDNLEIENISDSIKANSLIVELKFICLNKNEIIEKSNLFKKNNLNISNIYCTSYVKTNFYKKDLEKKKNFIFLDIGFERSTALIYINNKFEFLNSVSIGGNTITKDISKVLNLNIEYSENLKIKLNNDEDKISLKEKMLDGLNPFSEISEKNISINTLKEIIEARLDEIIEIAVIKNNYFKKFNTLEKPCLILIGDGSRLLVNINKLKIKNKFAEFIHLDENDSMICEAGFNYSKSEESLLTLSKKKTKKVGFFEGFFNLFSR
tara:strand:- start:6515 stop:7678 length:1164 start_codon:yes stop_codon:yes gene_type:complete